LIALFLFYNKATGKQDNYAASKYFRHVDVYTHTGDYWVVHRFGNHGIEYFISKFTNGADVLAHTVTIPAIVRVVAVDIETRATFRWVPLWGRTCNELARYLTGVNIGVTYSPRHLYSKLLRYDHRRNYTILTVWRRNLWGSLVETTKTTKATS
jgi:hypothetical protein